ncbi:hypothetical protein R3P38DRAFT_2986297 [Favolaschia claudopus]|uniref:Uncharacterized protein n=1 Tax=Favolaschia claudopus TaxID=2862362 RepID=A0AAW0AXH9_9AGAR
MPPIRGSRRAPPPEACGNINGFLPDAYTTINGGTGGSGGGGGMHGGAGGNGEGPQFHISALETSWNILVNGNAHYHCDSLNHASNPHELVLQRQATPDVLLLIFRRLSEYIEGDREKALFVMYCTLFAILFPGSLKLTDRLRLVPLIALPFLVIPSILSLNDTITLVDVMGERRPVLLAVWKNQQAFMEKLREFCNNNEEISAIIETDQYRIQDAEYSVYQLGSRMVSAGATLFMTAVVFYMEMGSTVTLSCPWCDTRTPALRCWNFQAFRDCTSCKRRFSTSHSDSPAPRNTNWSTVVSNNTLRATMHPQVSFQPNPLMGNKKTDNLNQLQTATSNISFRFIHLLLTLPRIPQSIPPPVTKPTSEGRFYVPRANRGLGPKPPTPLRRSWSSWEL